MKNLSRLIMGGMLMATTATIFADGLYTFGDFGRLYNYGYPTIDNTARNSIDKYGYRLGLGFDVEQSETYDLGALIGFGYYGKTIWNNYNNDAQYAHTIYGYDLQAVGTYHTTPIFDLLLHGGVIFTQNKTVENFQDHSENHVSPILGLGAAWNFQPNLAATFDYDHIFGKSSSTSSFNRQPTMNIYWLGIIYRFKTYSHE